MRTYEVDKFACYGFEPEAHLRFIRVTQDNWYIVDSTYQKMNRHERRKKEALRRAKREAGR